jgi:SAM-dependent methyltransferase
MPDDLIAEQIEYYRARAPEYDEWCDRREGYDLGPEANALWARDVAVVENALDVFLPSGRVLELACGTGWWTQRLARYAAELTCVDASEETIAIAREKASARYIVADIFTWEPTETYDVAFFSFWLSHVPRALFESFWALVDRALVPGGRVFFIDNLKRPVPQIDGLAAFLQKDDQPDGVVTRKLNDGTEFRAVKVYHEAAELSSRLAGLGWDVDVRETEAFFYYGSGGRRG